MGRRGILGYRGLAPESDVNRGEATPRLHGQTDAVQFGRTQQAGGHRQRRALHTSDVQRVLLHEPGCIGIGGCGCATVGQRCIPGAQDGTAKVS